MRVDKTPHETMQTDRNNRREVKRPDPLRGVEFSCRHRSDEFFRLHGTLLDLCCSPDPVLLNQLFCFALPRACTRKLLSSTICQLAAKKSENTPIQKENFVRAPRRG